MAMIEPHREKKFGFRVRVVLKLTQKGRTLLDWFESKLGFGKVVSNRTTFDWIVRNQKDVEKIIVLITPFLRVKKEQARIALQIVRTSVESKDDLEMVARLADTLSAFNPRSRNRRKNYATMI